MKGFSSFCLANKHFTSSCYFNDPWLWNETLQLMRCMLLINCSCCRKKKKTINLPHSSVLNANHCDCTSDEERHLYCRSSAARSDSVSSEIDFTLSSQLTLFSLNKLFKVVVRAKSVTHSGIYFRLIQSTGFIFKSLFVLEKLFKRFRWNYLRNKEETIISWAKGSKGKTQKRRMMHFTPTAPSVLHKHREYWTSECSLNGVWSREVL